MTDQVSAVLVKDFIIKKPMSRFHEITKELGNADQVISALEQRGEIAYQVEDDRAGYVITALGQQMFPDEFIGEVIGIVKIAHLSFDFYDRTHNPREQVRVEFRGEKPEIGNFYRVTWGETMGECLRKVREGLRKTYGE